MRRFILGCTLMSLVCNPITTIQAACVDEGIDFNPHYLIADSEMLDSSSMSLSEIQLFLNRGYLGEYSTKDLDGVPRTASEIIYNVSQTFEISPKFILTLLQKEQSLVEDETPSQNQLDWAMGYGVCDSCSKSDPRLQKFKGFPNQVYYAIERIRESYLTDLERHGYTESGIGPGIATSIDGSIVIPVNFATSSLYTYTPHLHGNENFVNIWNQWFTRQFLSGTLLQDHSSGGIWLIQNGYKRPITSQAAFYSRFNPNLVISTSTDEIDKYPTGLPISFANYSLLRSPSGTVYLIVDDVRHGFASQEAFRAIGYVPDEIVDVTWDDLEAYTEGLPITTSSVYPQGALLQSKTSGGIFYVENGLKYPIYSKEILTNRFDGLTIVPVDDSALESYERSDAVLFADGTLIAAVGSPDVFVISSGQRHHIEDEMTFHLYGWSFDQVVWTNERSVLLHDLGEPVSIGDVGSNEFEITSH